MNSSLNHGSAKIYQFPAGGRAALGGRRHEETKPATVQGSTRVNEAGLQRQLVPRGGDPGVQAAVGALMPAASPVLPRFRLTTPPSND